VPRPAAVTLSLVFAGLAAEPAAAVADGAGWRPPVGGAVLRAFDLGPNPYEGGRHRGVDFATAAGRTVRASCPGMVVVAGRVGSSGGVVTVLCGRWRASHLPMATIDVRVGQEVDRGAVLGTAAASREHRGLHFGVRRDGVRFGYVDPLRFLAADRHAPPVAARPARRGPPRIPAPERVPRRAPDPARRPLPVPAPRVAREPARHPAPRTAHHPAPGLAPAGPRTGGTAPWPAWVGVALILAGLAAGGRQFARPRRASAPASPLRRLKPSNRA
jgi:Peptidase family M23